jgi:hypothetical protein
MNCKKNWTLDTLDTYITKSFRNKELKEHREKVLIDRERSLLPATIPEVARFKKIKEHEEQLRKYGEEHREISRKINDVTDALFSLKYHKAPKITAHFSIHCPANKCKGFIESTSWECGLCKASVCKKCHECKTDEDHTCIEANVETAKLIKKIQNRVLGVLHLFLRYLDAIKCGAHSAIQHSYGQLVQSFKAIFITHIIMNGCAPTIEEDPEQLVMYHVVVLFHCIN